MKFFLALATLAPFTVLSEGQESGASLEYKRPETIGYKRPEAGGYSRPGTASFKKEEVRSVLNVATKGSNANSSEVIESVKAFFKRNPTILKSIEKVSNDPKNKKVKDEITSKAISTYTQSSGNLNLYDIGLKAINYAYEKPEVLKFIQDTGIQVYKDSPSLVDDFFDSFEKMVEKDPSLVSNKKKAIIAFSKENEDAYLKVYEMILKSALLDIKTSSHATIRSLQVAQIACSGSKSDSCSCDNKDDGEESNKYEDETEESGETYA